MFYQLVPGCRLCQAGWRWSQQLQALRTRWQRCKLTKNGRKPNVAPQSGTKYLAQKKKSTERPPKEAPKQQNFQQNPISVKKKKERSSQLIRARCFIFVKLNRRQQVLQKTQRVLTGSASSCRSWIPRFHEAFAKNFFSPKSL